MKQLLLFIILIVNLSCVTQHSKVETSNAEKDFETFYNTFKDNYAFFKLKKVDWDSTYTKFRPLVTESTTEKQLLVIFQQMVEPLKDGHITISKGDKILYKVKKHSQFKEEFKGVEKAFWETVDKTLVDNNFEKSQGVGPKFKEENLFYISANPNFTYLRITRCFGNVESLFDDKKEEIDTKLMLKLLDSLLVSHENSKALIIDIRSNGGGHGGQEMASRFLREKTLTYYKATRKKGDYDKFTPLEPIYLTPNIGVQYLKPIIILTSDRTASSAEDFTLCLYQQQHVTVIGTNTSGMLSDMLGTDLSNGISFTLSNQAYYSVQKQLLEDIGAPVSIEVRNSIADIENSEDPVLKAAIDLLKK